MYSELINKSNYVGNRLCFIREVIEQYQEDDESLPSGLPLSDETASRLTSVIDSMVSQLDSISAEHWKVFQRYWRSEWRSTYQDHLDSLTSRNENDTDES